MRILVDAMGGDNAPHDIVNGSIDAINEMDGYDIDLIGDSEEINRIVSSRKFNKKRLHIVHAREMITNTDMPTKAIKVKKESSMVIGFNLLKEKKGDIFLSAGNSGALLIGALLILGRIKGVDRPALAPVIPTKNGGALLIDAGINTICKPINYLQFGIMGSIYMKERFKIKNPRIGLINVGSEEKKGNEAIKQAFNMLSGANVNFVGNIEGRQIPEGDVDVAVCDGFVGNVLLKFIEGVGSFIFNGLNKVYSKNIISKISALAVKRDIRNFFKKMDYEDYGAAPLLGVNGNVMKSHGSSNTKTIKNAIIKAYTYARISLVEQIRQEFKNVEVEDIDQ